MERLVTTNEFIIINILVCLASQGLFIWLSTLVGDFKKKLKDKAKELSKTKDVKTKDEKEDKIVDTDFTLEFKIGHKCLFTSFYLFSLICLVFSSMEYMYDLSGMKNSGMSVVIVFFIFSFFSMYYLLLMNVVKIHVIGDKLQYRNQLGIIKEYKVSELRGEIYFNNALNNMWLKVYKEKKLVMSIDMDMKNFHLMHNLLVK